MTRMQGLRCSDEAGSACGDGNDASMGAHAALRWRLDPLGADEVTDEIVVTTTRRLLRLTTAAADVAARFVRDRAVEDPVEWMTAPRRLFDGETAMDACQDLVGFDRSVVVHGFGLDPDAPAEEVERLLSEEVDLAAAADSEVVQDGRHGLPRREYPRLLSCWVTTSGRRGRLIAFYAMVTTRPNALMDRVLRRYGAAAAQRADVTVGFDRGNVLVDAMIGEEMINTLLLAAADPRSTAVRGLDVVVEQRFAA